MGKKDEKILNEAKSHLESNEEVIDYVVGYFKSSLMGNDFPRKGIFLATESNLFFYGKKTFGYKTESFPYSNISSMETGKFGEGHSITLFASGNKVEIIGVTSPNVQEFISFLKGKIGKKNESKAQNISVADELKKFADLRDAGILTDEEFEAKKKQLLGI